MAGWGILHLKDTPDPIPVSLVEQDLRARWQDVVCRFPAVKQGLLDRDNPLSAYVFIQSPLSPKIEKSQFALRLLRDPVTRRLQKVTDVELAELIVPPSLPAPGTPVIITHGEWSGLSATVVETNCRSVKVLVELWSAQTLVTLGANEFTS